MTGGGDHTALAKPKNIGPAEPAASPAGQPEHKIPAQVPAVPAGGEKDTSSDKDAAIKKLEEEKNALLEKNKGLAEILELSAAGAMEQAQNAPAQPAFDPKVVESAIEAKMGDLKKDLASLDKKIALAQQKKEPTVTPQQLTDLASKFAAVEDKLKALDKINLVEQKITDMESAKKASDEEKDGLFGDMSAFEEQATVNAFGKTAAPRSLRTLDVSLRKLDEVAEARFHHMDKKVEDLERRLSPRALRILEKLAISGDRIVHELVPNEVKGEVDKIVNAFSYEVRTLAETVKKLAEDTERLNSETKNYIDSIAGIDERLKALENKVNEMERDERMLESVKHEVARIERNRDGFSEQEQLTQFEDMLKRFKDSLDAGKRKKMQHAAEDLEKLYRDGVIDKATFEDGMKKLAEPLKH